MKKHLQTTLQTMIIIMALLMAVPTQLYAEGITTDVVGAPPIVITEMQPGTAASGSQEFIELFNQSTQTIDLGKEQWQVQITSSKATSWDGAKSVSLTGMFYPGTYMLLASSYTTAGDTKSYLQDYASAQFTAGLTAASGHIRIVHAASGAVIMSDKFEWSTVQSDGAPTSSGIGGANSFLLESSLTAGSSIKRNTDANHVFMNSTEIAQNFAVSPCPSPTANNVAPDTPLSNEIVGPLATTVDITNPLCTAVGGSSGDDDELPTTTTEPPAVLIPSETNTTASTATAPSIPAADKGLSAPQITELLPNPGSPHTDAADEFVELYNPNAVAFDLSGFILEAGLTGNKQYAFPSGTTIAAHSFVAYFSETTKLSLSNSSGKVVLLDPLQRTLSQSDIYGAAKDDQAWARANGAWQWTIKPTPNAANVISQPVSKAKTSSKTATSKKTSTATTASAKKSSATNDAQLTANTVEDTPVHPLTLAVVGAFALLYGAYEYRHDVANKLYQFRRYREARREARSLLKGR